MIATAFDEDNCVLGPPPGMTEDQVYSLSVHRGATPDGLPVVVSCWKPTAEELAEIQRTGRVWLVIFGQTMPRLRSKDSAHSGEQGMIPSAIEHDAADVARFLTYVEKLDSGCWYWTGARSRGQGNRKWYGSFRVKGKTVRAHRFAAEVLAHSPCPPGSHRDHTCRFSMCVNPAHLEIVTREENERRKHERRKQSS